MAVVDVTDRRHDLPAPIDSEAFWKAVEKADEIGKEIAAGDDKTFAALILQYRDSDAYKKGSL